MMARQVSQLILLQPKQRLDSEGGCALQQEIAAIAPQSHQVWVIDMSHVDFLDSSGLFALVAGLSSARQHGCRLVLCNLKATVRLVFEISQLDTVFEIFDRYDTVLVSLDRDAASFMKAA
jgi:anti-anti-sigma factor